MDNLPWLLLGGILGGWIGYRLGYRAGGKWHKGLDRHYDFQPTATSTLRLHYLAKLDDRQFRRLCWWIMDGKSFTMKALMDAGILSRTEWVACRQELVDRRMAYRTRARTTEITLVGLAFFRRGAGRNNRAIDNQGDNWKQ